MHTRADTDDPPASRSSIPGLGVVGPFAISRNVRLSIRALSMAEMSACKSETKVLRVIALMDPHCQSKRWHIPCPHALRPRRMELAPQMLRPVGASTSSTSRLKPAPEWASSQFVGVIFL